jgi:hypothetical protein
MLINRFIVSLISCVFLFSSCVPNTGKITYKKGNKYILENMHNPEAFEFTDNSKILSVGMCVDFSLGENYIFDIKPNNKTCFQNYKSEHPRWHSELGSHKRGHINTRLNIDPMSYDNKNYYAFNVTENTDVECNLVSSATAWISEDHITNLNLNTPNENICYYFGFLNNPFFGKMLVEDRFLLREILIEHPNDNH